MGKEQNSKLKKYCINIISGAAIIFSVVIAFRRNCYGIEITDEAHYVSEAISILRGNAPLVFTMSDKPFFPILLAECIKIYQLFVPDLEGVFLFSRIVFLAFRFCISGVIFILLRKEFDQNYLIFAICVLFTIWGHSIPNLSYNTISCWLIILAGTVTFVSLTTQEKRKSFFLSGIAGILISLAVLTHFGQALNAVWFGIVYLLFGKAKNRWSSFAIYACGGLGVLCIVLLCLSLRYGWNKFIFGVETAFFYINRIDTPTFSSNLRDVSANIEWVLALFGLSFILTFLYKSICIKNKTLPEINFKDTVLIAVVLCMLQLLLRFNDPGTNLHKVGAIGGVFLLACGLAAVVNRDSKSGYIIAIFMMFPVTYVLICGFLLDTMAYKRFWMFDFAFFGGILLYEKYFTHGNIMRKGLCFLTFALVFFEMISSEWQYLYREELLSELDTKVAEGVYRGIYTTANRAEDTQALEKYIREVTEKEDRLLFLDNVPVGYMMSEAVPCTPSTWDLTGYSYGGNNPTILYRYFENREEYPTKIIYVDFGRDEKLSIDDEGHLFNDFIDANYNFTESKFIGSMYEVRLYISNGKTGQEEKNK